MTLPDPRALVEAPVRRALARLTVRGIAIVAIVGAAVLCPVAFPSLDRGSRDALAVLVPGGLLGLAVLLKLAQLLRGRTSEEARDRAWARAREVDAEDASLALMTAGWVPVALAVALGFHVWPHLTDPNPAIAAAWVVLGLPPVVLAWLLVTTAWLESCRDDLARSEGEADARFRRYWADLRH